MMQTAPDQIVRVSADILRIPTIRAHKLSVATMTEQRSVLVRIETESGNTGMGEAATIGGLAYADESPDSIQLTIERYFAPLLIGRDASQFGALVRDIDASAVGNFFAKMAIETALLDLAGKSAGLPLSELVGGRQRDRLEVAWTLASGDTAQDIEEGRSVLSSRRHRHFKLKIGKRAWQEDVRHCGAIAEAFSGEASVRVDVNQAWDFATAKQAIPALEQAGVSLIEQPIAGYDDAGARILREHSKAAIMADEALRGGPQTAMRIAKAGAADVFALKIAQAGGLMKCRAVAEIAKANGIGLYGGTMLEGPVATIASAHLFSALPEMEWGTELFGPLLLTEDILANPLDYSDFGLTVPDGPGLGITLNEDAVSEAIARDKAETR